MKNVKKSRVPVEVAVNFSQAVDVREVLRLLWQAMQAFIQDRGPETAASLTFTTLFAVVPVGTLLLTAVSVLPWLGITGQQMQDQIFHQWIPGVGAGIQPYIQGFLQHAARLTTLGLGMLFLTSIMMFISVEKALNRLWRVHTTHTGRVALLRYWAAFSLGPLLMGAALGLSSFLGTLKVVDEAQHMVHAVFPGLSLLSWGLTVLAFSLIYAVVPHCRVPRSAAWIGGLVAALLFELVKALFGWFVLHMTSYTLIYGAWASFPFFLIWVDLAWVIVLFGAQLSRMWALRLRTQLHEPPVIVFFRLLDVFRQCQQQGTALSETELMQRLGLLTRDEWQAVTAVLLEQHWIVRTSDESFVLNRDLYNLRLWSLLRHSGWVWPSIEALQVVQQGWARRLEQFLRDTDQMAVEMLPLRVAELWESTDA